MGSNDYGADWNPFRPDGDHSGLMGTFQSHAFDAQESGLTCSLHHLRPFRGLMQLYSTHVHDDSIDAMTTLRSPTQLCLCGLAILPSCPVHTYWSRAGLTWTVLDVDLG